MRIDIGNNAGKTKIISSLSKSNSPMLLQQILYATLAYQTVAKDFCYGNK